MGKTIPSQDLRILQQQEQRRLRLVQDPTCSKCKKTKTIDDFTPVGVCYWCNACYNEYGTARYHKKRAGLTPAELRQVNQQVNEKHNKQRATKLARMSPVELAAFRVKDRAYTKASRDRVRDNVYAAYGGYKCNCCGEAEKAFLSIDHVNNDGAEFRRKHGHKTGEQCHRYLIRNKFPKDFQVLCMNCQWGKRNNNGVCPHQVRRNDQSESS